MTFKTKMIIKQIAMENGTTPEVVEAEMRKAIRQAMASSDPNTQAFWK